MCKHRVDLKANRKNYKPQNTYFDTFWVLNGKVCHGLTVPQV